MAQRLLRLLIASVLCSNVPHFFVSMSRGRPKTRTGVRKGNTNCAAFGCSSSYSNDANRHFFRFPKSDDRCKQWATNTNTQRLIVTNANILSQSYRLCDLHFESDQFQDNGKNKLKRNAIPTIFCDCKASKHKTKLTPSNDVMKPLSPCLRPLCLNNARNVQVLKRKLKNALTTIRKLKRHLVKNVGANADSNKFVNISSLTVFQKEFVLHQIRNGKVVKNGRRWSKKMKTFFSLVRQNSPKCYHLLSTELILPSKTSVVRLHKQFPLHPGFNNSGIFKCLKEICQKMKSQEKHCSLMFDSMSIKKFFQYEKHSDKVIGLVDMGEFGTTSSVATNAMVFMIRGLSTNWKQAICYVLIGNSLVPCLLWKMITKCIKNIEKAGLLVVNIVCDQECNQQKLFRQLNVTAENPFVVHPIDNSRKLYFLYDVPHLIKNIRNNFINYDIKFHSGVARWADVQMLYELESQSSIRFCPKIKAVHINPPPFTKMRVCLAAQVLSHSCAAAIHTYVDLQKMPRESVQTAVFLQEVNDMFDMLNSTHIGATGFNKPLTKHTLCNLYNYTRFIDFVNGWSFWKGDKEGFHLAIKSGLLITLSAFKELTISLLMKSDFGYVCTSRFHQDPVENLFSCIRASSGHCVNPTVTQFQRSFKTYTLCKIHLLKTNSNCREDFDYNLCQSHADLVRHDNNNVEMFFQESQAGIQNNLIDIDSDSPPTFLLNISRTTQIACNIIDYNVVAYISGFLARVLVTVSGCDSCNKVLTSPNLLSLPDYATVFFRNKNVDSSRMCLTLPSPTLFHYCCIMEETFRSWKLHCGSFPNKPRQSFLSYFANICLSKSLEPNFTCSIHEGNQLTLKARIIDKFFNIRYHFYLTLHNRFISAANIRNKYLKVAGK